MACEDTRRHLASEPTSSFDDLVHLQTCASCRALADRIRVEEGALHQVLDAWQAQPLSVPRHRTRMPRVILALATAATLALAFYSLWTRPEPASAVALPAPKPLEVVDEGPPTSPVRHEVPAVAPVPAPNTR